MGPSKLIKRVREEGVAALAVAVPYAEFLGLSYQERDGQLLARMAYRPHLIGNSAIPALHGGTVGALLESIAICQVIHETRLERIPKIVTLTVEYLRSGRPVDSFARASITRLGRRVVNVHAEAWQDDPARPIATANAIMLVPQPQP